jgi:hypothetical protein
MKSSVAAKQIAFRMSSYNGFATRCPAPGPTASPPAKFLEFLDSFAPAAGTEHAAMVTQAACYRPSTGHTC